jgi:hypothetical protein
MNNPFFACRLFFVGIICSSMVTAMAQVKPYTFPKIKSDDFKTRGYEKDTSAEAVILGDKGESYLEYNDTKGFQLIFTRHLRIRILSKEGYMFATHSIPLYRSTGSAEKLTELKGITYNLIDGKVEDDKLGSSNIFEEEVNLNWVLTSFTLPNLKVGSIIDIRYKIVSDYIWNIREWQFQYPIPVQWSEYIVTMPEYYVFSKLVHGSSPFAISETTTIPGSISIVTKERGSAYGLGNSSSTVQTHFETEQVSFIQNVYHFAVCDVPALKEESYAPAMTNYVSKVEFELHHSQFPGSGRKDYTTTWEDICSELMRDKDFGEQFQRRGIVKEAVKAINAIASTPLEKMIAAHAYIRSRMIWNGKTGLYCTNSLHEAYEKHTGNDADINLLLFLLLKELDLDASPVVLSTRNNGIILESHPVLTKLNYVLASVTIEDKTYLLDATGKHRPFNFLPTRCLNGSGLLVSRDKMRWVPLLGGEKENKFYYADMKISGEGIISGSLKVSYSGISAEEIRDQYSRDGEEKYFTTLRENHKDWKIEGIKIENIDSLSSPVNQVFNITSEDIAQVNDNLIYFNALLGFGQNNNPFKDEKRESVVDFIYPLKESYLFTFELPEGYIIESFPEPTKVMLPDQAGFFRFTISAAGNKVTVNSNLIISKVMYTAEEYSDLREFFVHIVAKHAQQIVLKKT